MSLEYDNYIREHIENVKKGLEWMQQNLPNSLFNHDALTEAILDAEQHDQSKYSKEEYDAYDAYFYGGNKTFQVQENFDKAWLHHIHNNPHHWQHWVLINDNEGIMALDMPLKYVYEMIADWWTFSWRAGNLMEIFNWYSGHRDKMMLTMKTRFIVESILSAMFSVLKMQLMFEKPSVEIPEFIVTLRDIGVEAVHEAIEAQEPKE